MKKTDKFILRILLCISGFLFTTLSPSYSYGILNEVEIESRKTETPSCPETDEVIEVVITDISCPGAADGEIKLILTGNKPFSACIVSGCTPDEDADIIAGLKSSSYTWFGLQAGFYHISITDGIGCEYNFCVEVAQPAPLESTLSYQPILCHGAFTDVQIGTTGGYPPYTLKDSEGSTIALFDAQHILPAQPANNYRWTLTDSRGCTEEISLEISQPSLLVVQLTETQDAFCQGTDDGEAWFSISGGTPPYTTNMGEFSNDLLYISELAGGNHTLLVSDANSCEQPTDFSIALQYDLSIDRIDITLPICPPDNYQACNEPWAVAVVEYVPGTTAGGGRLPSSRRIKENALGAPDYSYTPPITFVSLGFSGHIILETGCDILNGEGYDFEVVETSFGNPACHQYPEKAEVYVAQSEQGPWSFLGIACLTSSFDLSDGVDENGQPFILESARFVKIVEASNPADFSSGTDGYDVNGITIFNYGTTDSPSASIHISYSGLPPGAEPLFSLYDSTGNLILSTGSNVIEGLLPGSYSVIMHAGECFSDEEIFVIPEFYESGYLTLDILDITNTTCKAQQDGSISYSISGGVAPYTVCLVTGCEDGEIKTLEPYNKEEHNTSMWGLKAGWYSLSVIDGNGCEARVCVYIGTNGITADFTVEPACELIDNSIGFISPGLSNVDLSAFPWSTGNTVVQTNLGDLEIGNSLGTVTAYSNFANNQQGQFSQRGTHGLGILGGTTNEVDGTEGIRVDFEQPVYLSSFLVRSMFKEGYNGQAEQAKALLYLAGELTDDIQLIAVEVNGTTGELLTLLPIPVLIDRIEFFIPQGKTYSAFSSFTLSRITLLEVADLVNIYPEAAGDAEPLGFIWSNGATTANLMGVPPGTYSVMIFDANGCAETFHVEAYADCADLDLPVADNTNNEGDEKLDDPLSDERIENPNRASTRAYPNPFRQEITFEYTLGKQTDVSLEVYNLIGERVAIIFRGETSPFETRSHTFAAGILPNGIYLFRLTAGDKIYYERVVLSR